MGIVDMISSVFGARKHPKQRRMPTHPSQPKTTLVWDDLVAQATDAVVNAADWSMMGGTGVDGAIHEGAGRDLGAFILAHCLRLETGQALATPGFKLAAKHIIHTCAPVYEIPCDADLRSVLRLSYTNSIALADSMGLSTLALPLLGAGAFGWPIAEAVEQCRLAIKEESLMCESLLEIRVCAFGPLAFGALQESLGILGSVSPAAASGALGYHAGASATQHLSADEILRGKLKA
jgi:O-acetyl-ADP-ribose deacetylase (regulator of RNase III)